jgi:hypothetical protein
MVQRAPATNTDPVTENDTNRQLEPTQPTVESDGDAAEALCKRVRREVARARAEGIAN